MKNFIKNIGVIITILGFSCLATTCSFGKEVQNYNPKDNNPKSGLYYIGETKYFPKQGTVLKDGRVLILTASKASHLPERVDGVEIFDPTNNKLQQYLPLPHPLFFGQTVGGIFPTLVLDDGRVLFNSGLGFIESGNYMAANYYQILNPITNEISVIGRSNMCRRYDNKSNPTYYSAPSPSMMNYLGKGKVASYCGNRMEEMEIIDLNNNSVSKPIKKDNANYIIPPEKYPKGSSNFIYQDFVDSFRNLYPELNLNERLMDLRLCKLTENKYLVISRSEADYGILTKKVLNGRSGTSWFSPLYEYDTKTNEFTKKNEYLRSFTGSLYHLKDTNKIIIIGGRVRDIFPPINPNSEPSKISLINRILYPNWAYKITKKIYIYVY